MSKLKLLRTGKKLSQRELAEKSGVSLRTLQHYEIGDRDINGASLETLLKLSDVLEIRFYELLDDDLQEKIIKNLGIDWKSIPFLLFKTTSFSIIDNIAQITKIFLCKYTKHSKNYWLYTTVVV